MPTYEYQMLPVPQEAAVERLNDLGRDGWHVVAALPEAAGGAGAPLLRFVLERETESGSNRGMFG